MRPKPGNSIALGLVFLICACLAGGCAPFSFLPAHTRGMAMDTRFWQTHYVGRYAIDLPPGAKTELRTTYGIT